MSRYRKIEVKMWGDEKFRELSPLPPSGQSLWLFLLTGPHTGIIPGLFRAGRAGMAEELGWDQEDFDKAFEEAFRLGMVKADWKARVVWVPNGIRYNRPESPNVVTGWGKEFDLIPDCVLKNEAILALATEVYNLDSEGKTGFRDAFDKAFGKALLKASEKTMPNQEQEQEQEQQQEQEPKTEKQPLAPAVAIAPKKSAESKEEPNPLNLETWQSYKQAYSDRYGVAPVRDAATNAKIKAIVKALGCEAPAVAAFFVFHNGSRYVAGMHQIGLLSVDYAKLRTEWATNTRMTATKALQADKTQTNFDAFAPLIAEAEARERANG